MTAKAPPVPDRRGSAPDPCCPGPREPGTGEGQAAALSPVVPGPRLCHLLCRVMPRTVRLAAAWRSELVAVTVMPPGALRAFTGVIVSRLAGTLSAVLNARRAPRRQCKRGQGRDDDQNAAPSSRFEAFTLHSESPRVCRGLTVRQAMICSGSELPIARSVMPAGQAAKSGYPGKPGAVGISAWRDQEAEELAGPHYARRARPATVPP